MDGDRVLSPERTIELRILPKSSIRIFNINAEKIVPVPWDFGKGAFGRLRTSKLGVPWIVLRAKFEDDESDLGLAVRIWQRLWDTDDVTIARCIAGLWIPLEKDEEWEVLNAKP